MTRLSVYATLLFAAILAVGAVLRGVYEGILWVMG